MSARPEHIALLDEWLSEPRSVEDKLAQLRNLVCDIINAGEDLRWCELEKRSPREAMETWSAVMNGALSEVDALTGEILKSLGVVR